MERVAKAIKYFEITDENSGKVWHCRAIPYDSNKENSNKKIVFLQSIPYDWTAKTLDEKFSSVGPVKSAKVIYSPGMTTETLQNGESLLMVDDTLSCISKG